MLMTLPAIIRFVGIVRLYLTPLGVTFFSRVRHPKYSTKMRYVGVCGVFYNVSNGEGPRALKQKPQRGNSGNVYGQTVVSLQCFGVCVIVCVIFCVCVDMFFKNYKGG